MINARFRRNVQGLGKLQHHMRTAVGAIFHDQITTMIFHDFLGDGQPQPHATVQVVTECYRPPNRAQSTALVG